MPLVFNEMVFTLHDLVYFIVLITGYPLCVFFRSILRRSFCYIKTRPQNVQYVAGIK